MAFDREANGVAGANAKVVASRRMWDMHGSQDRVVRQLQLRLLGDDPAAGRGASMASPIAVLQERVAKLRRLGSQYAGVRVSRHVTDLRETAVAERRGKPVVHGGATGPSLLLG